MPAKASRIDDNVQELGLIAITHSSFNTTLTIGPQLAARTNAPQAFRASEPDRISLWFDLLAFAAGFFFGCCFGFVAVDFLALAVFSG
jgi:hypothetical protein